MPKTGLMTFYRKHSKHGFKINTAVFIYKLLINEQPKISTSNTVSISHLFKHLLLTKWIKFFLYLTVECLAF